MSSLPMRSLAIVAAMLTSAGVPVAAQDPVNEVTVVRDLGAVIALQGHPCGQVVGAARRGENDYVATCEDGNRYRISINQEGRVIVEKLA